MIPDDGQKIISWVAMGDPWKALGVSKNTTRSDISIEHLKLCNKYKNYPEVVSALNKAKANLYSKPEVKSKEEGNQATRPGGGGGDIEKETVKTLRLSWSRISHILASIISSKPLGVLASVGVFLVFLNIHDLILVFFFMFLIISFITCIKSEAFYKNGFENFFYILIWSGFFASSFLLLNKIKYLGGWKSYSLSLISSSLLTFCFHDPLVKQIHLINNKSTVLKCIGVFNMLFMFVFGIEYLLIADLHYLKELFHSLTLWILNNTYVAEIISWVNRTIASLSAWANESWPRVLSLINQILFLINQEITKLLSFLPLWIRQLLFGIFIIIAIALIWSIGERIFKFFAELYSGVYFRKSQSDWYSNWRSSSNIFFSIMFTATFLSVVSVYEIISFIFQADSFTLDIKDVFVFQVLTGIAAIPIFIVLIPIGNSILRKVHLSFSSNTYREIMALISFFMSMVLFDWIFYSFKFISFYRELYMVSRAAIAQGVSEITKLFSL